MILKFYNHTHTLSHTRTGAAAQDEGAVHRLAGLPHDHEHLPSRPSRLPVTSEPFFEVSFAGAVRSAREPGGEGRGRGGVCEGEERGGEPGEGAARAGPASLRCFARFLAFFTPLFTHFAPVGGDGESLACRPLRPPWTSARELVRVEFGRNSSESKLVRVKIGPNCAEVCKTRESRQRPRRRADRN